MLAPVWTAPDVLAVNSDFDEGRIDPATGYAIPDCDDIPGVDWKTGAGNSELRIDTSAHMPPDYPTPPDRSAVCITTSPTTISTTGMMPMHSRIVSRAESG